jgi:hypothetical protein
MPVIPMKIGIIRHPIAESSLGYASLLAQPNAQIYYYSATIRDELTS